MHLHGDRKAERGTAAGWSAFGAVYQPRTADHQHSTAKRQDQIQERWHRAPARMLFWLAGRIRGREGSPPTVHGGHESVDGVAQPLQQRRFTQWAPPQGVKSPATGYKLGANLAAAYFHVAEGSQPRDNRHEQLYTPRGARTPQSSVQRSTSDGLAFTLVGTMSFGNRFWYATGGMFCQRPMFMLVNGSNCKDCGFVAKDSRPLHVEKVM
eukprot:364571-Chlamydomonas_euryale.AAC.3